ncbi:hypothetical protein AB0D58_35335 [Streptomyces sp. NPDC048210]|uniref:hypothetical protein n=1 Tax=unclassified Streptomyces TaxID=2593676 RepID=UPI002E795418|nr:hypothetical protein [Streptomyces sp. JV181]MEE1775613.1 hypothetical protein [Streptomyces sp. JV181]
MAHPGTRYRKDHVSTPRPWGYEYAAFKESHFGEDYQTGYLTGWEADGMIGRAVKRRHLVAVDVLGTLWITPSRRPQRRIVLTPVRVLASLTGRQYEDLALIEAAGSRARIRRAEDGAVSIEAGMMRIPPAAAWILRRRGWTSEIPHTRRVAVSAAGRMAMVHRWHRSEDLNRRLLTGLYLDAALSVPQAPGLAEIPPED